MYNKTLDKMTELELEMIDFLAMLYQDIYDTDEFDYETVDKFYAYLGYNLYAETLLNKLSIQSTSDLQEMMLKVENYL